ncbi:MAG: helix-turn-helix domain-containing protein [Prevotella sp.]|jgi:HTH-type transcriptional regulator/antitoxin HigA|nr:helix-turn-helix domain-containing protein [Prevotella sp.]MDR2022283.1 helix-turn-helix domain-containing protein [Hungatella sp.]
MLHSKNAVAVPPGETIREQLENRGMSQKEFAHRMGMSEKHISELLNGKVELTYNVSLRLESVLGVPAKFWNNLEALYREKLARVNAELEFEKDEEIAQKFPYAKLAELGWLKPTRKITEKVENLRSYFEVARLDLLETIKVPGIAYRKVGENETSDYASAAWAQRAKLLARNIEVSPINIKRLKDIIPQIRSLTIQNPEVFCEKLKNMLSECGVAIVFLPHVSGSFLHGASFIDGNHIVLGLTVRGKDADKFWFSLFHELYHIIEGHIYSPDGTTEEQETLADQFARDTLIPMKNYQKFIEKGDFSEVSIVLFAKSVDVKECIVLGRLQKENFVPYNWHQSLKVRYKIE